MHTKGFVAARRNVLSCIALFDQHDRTASATSSLLPGIDDLIASLKALLRKVAAAKRKAKRRLLTIQAIRCLAVIAHFAIYVVQHLLVRDIVFAFNFAAILERRVTSRQENEGLCVQ